MPWFRFKAATTAGEGGTAIKGDYSGPAIELSGSGDWNIHGGAATATLAWARQRWVWILSQARPLPTASSTSIRRVSKVQRILSSSP